LGRHAQVFELLQKLADGVLKVDLQEPLKQDAKEPKAGPRAA
jgi:hypothetical protein